MAVTISTPEELLQRLQRDVNCVSDDNKAAQRRALEKLRKETVGHTPHYSSDFLQEVFESLLKPLLKSFSASSERCREIAINLVAEFMSMVKDPSHFLPLIVPVVVSRLGTNEITEPSEELRLTLVTFLTSVVTQCSEKMAPYLTDLITILKQTIVDSFPEVKKESCVCCCRLSECVEHVFHQQSELLTKPLLLTMTHQHSKVRLASVKALGSVIQYGTATPINESLPTLAQRACDSSPSVRMCLFTTVGNWLLDLRDRYSYHHKLLPLLLTGVGDEVEEVKRNTLALWDKVGAKYESENEDDMKDKLNFAKFCEPSPELGLPRPRLGCRVLVYRNFSKILPAILRDIVDWTLQSRIKSSQLLLTLLFHLEEHATHHIQSVLNGLYRASQDEERIVVDHVTTSARLIGHYASSEVWSHLVLPAVRVSAGCRVKRSKEEEAEGSSVAVGPVQCTGCITVLTNLVIGADKNEIVPRLQAIVECLAEQEVSQTEHAPLFLQLLSCVSAIIDTVGEVCASVSHLIFTILLRVAASRHIREEQVEEQLLKLAKAQQLQSSSQLYIAHARSVLVTIKQSGYQSWSSHSPNCFLFSSLLSGAGVVAGQLLEEVLPILSFCIHPDRDPEMRLQFISLLIKLVLCIPPSPQQGEESSSDIGDTETAARQQFQKFSSSLVTDIVVPSCVWRAGRTASALRTAALTVVQALLQSCLLPIDQLAIVLPELLPQVVTCMDDDNSSTRLVACKVLSLLLQNGSSIFTVDKLHTMYCDLLKRLDDSSDEIRVETTRTLHSYVRAFPPNAYYKELYSAHTEALFKGLLVHLDDPSPHIQEAVFAVLKMASSLNKPQLQKLVEDVKHKHRTERYCNDLLAL